MRRVTEQDVADLYRCLLNRAPETPDTVAAFRAYYADFQRGRRAILQSAEFTTLYGDLQGDAAARLANAFLRRAGGSAPICAANNAALRGAMQLILRQHGAVHLAVIVGDAAPIEDLLPVQTGRTAILHVAPAFPPVLPQLAVLPGGATLFRIGLDAGGLGALLQAAGLRIDLLAVLEADATWLSAMCPHLAGQSILLAPVGFPAAAGPWQDLEDPLEIGGLHIRFNGGWFLPVTYTEPPAPPAADPAPIPGLCVAAIVRQEQDAIANMLRSAAPVAASFVVLDTGSTDKTLLRAEAALQETGRPYTLQSQPPGRFDVMRNAALALAPPGTGWILMLDADEELCAEDHTALRTLLAAPTADAYALPRYNYVGADKSGKVTPYPDRQVRLLRHRTTDPLRYSGAVHETVRGVTVARLPLDAQALGLGAGGPHIHHLVRRFRSPAAEAAKQAFYARIAAEQGEEASASF
jgi:hypothetical protein